MKKFAYVCLAALVLSFSAKAASFDCTKSKTRVEKMICVNADLSKLDEDLTAAYTNALKVDGAAVLIRQEQKQWMKERNACVDVACVKNAYLTRQALLTKSEKRPDIDPSVQQSTKAHYGHCADVGRGGCETGNLAKTGKGYAVCETYLKHLNVITEIPKCEAPIPPKFKEPDWEELEISSHLPFAYQAEAIKFRGRGGGYKQPDFETWRQQFLNEMQAGNIAPQMRKTTVQPFGEKSITLLAYTRDRKGCEVVAMGRDSWWGDQGYVYFLSVDDSEKPLREIENRLSSTQSSLLLYSGKPYFVMTDSYYPSFEIIAFDPKMTDTAARVATMDAYYTKFGISQPLDTTKKYDPDPNVYWAGQLCHFLPIKTSRR